MLQFPDSAPGPSLVNLVSSIRFFWHVNHSVDPLADFCTSYVCILLYFPQRIRVSMPERKLNLKSTVCGCRSNLCVDTLTGIAGTPLSLLLIATLDFWCSPCSNPVFQSTPLTYGHDVFFNPSAHW